ncbi:MAG: hypothetical protein H0T48_06910 [Gemmatimonadaceae bacterium]|nr:hypothetical protein [Gemmatimonadaceae bacterium]
MIPPGLPSRIRGIADESGALLVFDEATTGFRIAPGGAPERFGVTSVKTTFGKLSGGLPEAACFFHDEPVHHFAIAMGSVFGMFKRAFLAAPERGGYLAPSMSEASFKPGAYGNAEVPEASSRIEHALEASRA